MFMNMTEVSWAAVFSSGCVESADKIKFVICKDQLLPDVLLTISFKHVSYVQPMQ